MTMGLDKSSARWPQVKTIVNPTFYIFEIAAALNNTPKSSTKTLAPNWQAQGFIDAG